VYTLVQDLDSAKTNLPSKSHDYKASVFRPSPSFQPHRFSTQAPSHKDDIKGKNFKRDNWNKGPDSSGISSTTKCYKCQDYGHLAASCPTLVKITIIDGTHPLKPLSQILMSIPITQMSLMMSHQAMMLVSTALGQRRLPIWLSSSVFPLHQQKRSIGEELRPFTRSPRLDTRVVRWLWTVKVISMQYHPGSVKILD